MLWLAFLLPVPIFNLMKPEFLHENIQQPRVYCNLRDRHFMRDSRGIQV